MTDSLLPEHRERLYPPTLALSMFMGGAGGRWFVPEGGEQLGGAARGGRLERAQREYGSLLQGARKIVGHDGQHAGPVHGKTVE